MQQQPPSPKQRVLVNVILDKSGSMSSKLDDVIGGFNAYLDGLAKEDQVEYLFTLTLFDTVLAHRDVALPLAQIRKLDAQSYLPGGNTALHDAIGATVRKVDADRPTVDKIITVIMTDGEENSSREWTLEGVKSLIDQKEKEGVWTFVFLGASPDAWSQGRSYGIPLANVAQYNPGQYTDVFAATARATNMAAASPDAQSPSMFSFFSKEMLKRAGIRRATDKNA